MTLLMLTLLLLVPSAATLSKDGSAQRFRQKIQTSEQGSPVTRVVTLLKDMQGTLQKELDEDQELFKNLACWCNTNTHEKDAAISEATAKIVELQSTIETLTARSDELKTKIAETEKQVSANKETLATATALREKEQKDFHGMELDSIQAIENLKAALVVLGKHHEDAFPQLSVSFLSIVSKSSPSTESKTSQSFDDFMARNMVEKIPADIDERTQKFLQQDARYHPEATKATPASSWSLQDQSTVEHAFRMASALLQSRHRSSYNPSYDAQSGELVGILQQMKEEMQADLSEAQKHEKLRLEAFAELRSSKSAEIEAGEKLAEQKEDELSKTMMDLAEAKEDVSQTSDALDENQKFLVSLKATCTDSDSKFQARKKERLEEIEAVADTIEILTKDEARDAMKGTFSFLQASSLSHNDGYRQRKAAQVLRRAGKKIHSPNLAVLATAVELDAFTKVKKAINDNIALLKQQQEDEVKKSDWCKAQLEENEMSTMKNQEAKEDGEAQKGELESKIKMLADEIVKATAQISELQVNLQRASENRKRENADYQKTFEDQTLTIAVLNKALDRLEEYYDKEFFLQTQTLQTPPVTQLDHSKSKAAGGVISMIEKLISEAKTLVKDSREAEKEAQAAYEETIENTNTAVEDLEKEVTSKRIATQKSKKNMVATAEDIADTVKELEALAKYNADLHSECDYILKNFDLRQQARGQELEALNQALQILKGASME